MTQRVIGFDISGDSLLVGDFIPLRDGLTVLYGLNGAGKTRLLTGIRNALTGVASDISVGMVVHASIEEWAEDAHPRRSSFLPVPIAYALAEAIAGPHGSEPAERNDGAWIHALSHAEVTRALDDAVWQHFEGRYISVAVEEPLAREVASQRLWLLAPTGTTETPRWAALPLFEPATPELGDYMVNFHAAEAASDDGGDIDFLNWPLVPPDRSDHGYERPLTGRASWRPYSYGSVGATDTDSWVHLTGPIDLGVDVVDHAVSIPLDELIGDAAVAALQSISERDTNDLNFGDLPRLRHPYWDPWRYVARFVLPRLDQQGVESMDPHTALHLAATTIASVLSEMVNEYLREVLMDAPRATLVVRPPLERFGGEQIRWEFERDPLASDARSVRLELSQLSRAERLWAERAIAEATYWFHRQMVLPNDENRIAITLIDEPESALHRAAEAHMARRLVSEGREPGRALIVSTHSPELLDAPEGELLELRRGALPPYSYRDNRRTEVRPLSLTDRDALRALGLTPGDLLRWTKVYLLVEGHHEALILDSLFGERLRQARVEIIVLGGAKNLSLPVVESPVLYKFSRAHVVAMVDAMQAEVLERVWEESIVIASIESLEAATEHIIDSLPGAAEPAFMRAWLIAALTNGVESRSTPYGLPAPDVLDYLPVTSFVKNAHSWNELREQHRAALENQRDTPKQFKAWFAKRGGVKLDDATITAAIHDLDAPPSDLERLMSLLESISASV